MISFIALSTFSETEASKPTSIATSTVSFAVIVAASPGIETPYSLLDWLNNGCIYPATSFVLSIPTIKNNLRDCRRLRASESAYPAALLCPPSNQTSASVANDINGPFFNLCILAGQSALSIAPSKETFSFPKYLNVAKAIPAFCI